jgi:formylmethanofuran dehydrogenase subunit E
VGATLVSTPTSKPGDTSQPRTARDLAAVAAAFHGELCPALAMGVQAAWLALDRLGGGDLMVVAEAQMCAIDAIQALTGCTLGNRNLVQVDHGKNVYTFFRRGDGRAIRVSGRGSWDEPYRELRSRANAGLASDEERSLLTKRKAEVVEAILDADPEALYSVAKVFQPLPTRPLTDQWLPCDACGELVMETRGRRLLGRNYCQPCFALARSHSS